MLTWHDHHHDVDHIGDDYPVMVVTLIMKMMTKMIVLRMRRRKVLFGHPENQADLGEDELESPDVHMVDIFYVSGVDNVDFLSF